MIEQFWFKNFKLLRDVSLELGPLNVIVGRNGVGKSTVLEGMHLLSQVASGAGNEDMHTDRSSPLTLEPRPLHRWASRLDGASFELMLRATNDLAFGLKTERGKAGRDHRFVVSYGTSAEVEQIVIRGGRIAGVFIPDPFSNLGAAVRLKLHAEALSEDHYSETEQPVVAYTGEGLPSLLQYLQGLRDGTMELIEADLRRVVPDTRRVRTLPAKIRRRELVRIAVDGQEKLHDQWREFTGARFEVEFDKLGWIPADQLSEGTILALGLITILRHQPPRLVLLDDIDKALHPVAQREVVKLIRAILADQPDVQVVATSHSPFVLDELEASEAFVAGAIDASSSQVRRLDTHPAWLSRKDVLHPGEFWSAVGEGWVAKSSS